MLDQSAANLGVSVIVAVHNEEKYLHLCLRSLVSQNHPSFEIIVVDDGSTDNTLEISQAFSNQYSSIQALRQQHLGWTYGRNLGARMATGTILVFVDGDMEFDPDYLIRLVEPITCHGAAGTFSKEEYVANFDNKWAFCWNLNDGLVTNRRHPDDFPDKHHSFRAVRKDIFVSVGGYDHLGSGSDFSLSMKIGELAEAAPGAICYHYNPGSLNEVFSQGRWYGRGIRIQKTWRNVIRHSLPLSVIGSLRRAWRYLLPHFVLFKIVYDVGVSLGLLESLLFPNRTYR